MFRRVDGDIETRTEIAVSPEDDAELRRVSVTNRGTRARRLDLTSYAEVVLAPGDADLARAGRRPPLGGHAPDRRIFAGKRYLPIGLVEAGRGCHFRCEFCAVQSMFSNTQTRRPLDDVLS